jgi:hypothetical protein
MDEEDAHAEWRRRRASRIAQNERVARRHNRRREQLEVQALGVQTDEVVPFVCECADAECMAAVELSPAEYDAVHETPDRFVVKPGHVVPDVEHTIARNDRYWTVSKAEAEEGGRPDEPFPPGW